MSPADPPAPEAVDAALDSLLKVEPSKLAAKLKEMKAQAESLAKQSQEVKKQAEGVEAQVKAATAQLDAIQAAIQAVAKSLQPAPVEAPTVPMAPAAAAPAAAPAPKMEAKAMAPAAGAPTPAGPVTNFEQHIKPIIQARCSRCHNDEQKKSGLSLASFNTAMEGGSSGKVIVAGQPDGSRLFRLVSGAEQPNMPPSGGPLDAEQLKLIKQWIEQGALANAESKPVKAAAADMKAEQPGFVAATFRDGPPPMPEKALPAVAKGGVRGLAARAVAVSPRAPLMAVGGDKQIVLYDAEKYQPLGALPFPEGEVFALTFSLNGELLLAGGGHAGKAGLVVTWDVRKGERAGTYGEEFDTVLAADVSPDHTLIAEGGPNKVVKVFSTKDGKVLYKLDVHTDWVQAVKFTPDGELLATADRAGGLYLWQAANGRPVETLRGHTGAIYSLAYTSDSNTLASAGADGTVQFWDTWKYKKISQIAAHAGAALSVDFGADGQLVTTGADQLAKRWDKAGKCVSTYEKLPDWGYRACFGPKEGIVLAGTWTGAIEVFKSDSGEKLATLSTAPAS
ncbi:MAG: hypothetical protein HZB26_07985 [Candidatus Hydrogenedentes bacterium]|nr:hypothetical protein [Candidatus Hydrogenedentota bacterium]